MSIYDDFGECCHFHDYADGRLTLDDLLGDRREELTADSVSVYAMMDFDISFLKLSDYNALMKLYGMKQIELADGEYAICANASGMPEIYDKFLEDSPEITSFGKSFKPSSKKCIRNSFYPDMQPTA